MEHEQRSDGFTAIEDQYAGYEVYDRHGQKIGKVDDLFLDENDRAEYIGVKMGFLGLEGTNLIPWELARVDEEGRHIEVSVDKATAKEGPSFNDDEDITPEYENEVRSHYGLGAMQGGADRGTYGDYYADEEREGEVGPGVRMGDTETGEFRGHGRDQEGVNQPGDDLEDEDELRVQRTEEELRAGTREREAGAMRVRKRVRTDREQISMPTRHEEVSVERVPVEEGREASEAEIGEDEVTMPVTEEEVVTEKRPVVKEEIRVRKDVVQDEEVVEEDVRKEEVDVEDQTERGGGRLERDTDLGDEETRRRGR
jgi:uncharacterized protein (TIGR02271 family)